MPRSAKARPAALARRPGESIVLFGVTAANHAARNAEVFADLCFKVRSLVWQIAISDQH
jgi:hypothetical protein